VAARVSVEGSGTLVSLTPPRKLMEGTTGSLARKKQNRSALSHLVKMSAT
jgi:hypothetical protein